MPGGDELSKAVVRPLPTVRGNTRAPGRTDVGGAVDDGRVVVGGLVVGGPVVAGGRVVGSRVVDDRVVGSRVVDGRVLVGPVVVDGVGLVVGVLEVVEVLDGLVTGVELVETVVVGLVDGGRSRGSKELGSLGTVVGRSSMAGPVTPIGEAGALAARTSTVGRSAARAAPRSARRPSPPTTIG